MTKNQWSLRELYRNLTNDPQNSDIQRVQLAQEQLDQAVAIAYGMDGQADPLAFLLNLNLEVVEKEAKGDQVTAPGLPDLIHNPKDFISQDCVCI
jgi:hypothetical protein